MIQWTLQTSVGGGRREIIHQLKIAYNEVVPSRKPSMMFTNEKTIPTLHHWRTCHDSCKDNAYPAAPETISKIQKCGAHPTSKGTTKTMEENRYSKSV